MMHSHLSNIPVSAPTLRYNTLTSLLLFLQPLVTHLDLFQNSDSGILLPLNPLLFIITFSNIYSFCFYNTDIFNGSGVREAAYWNALFCFVPTFLHYLKKFLRNSQEVDQLATMVNHPSLSYFLLPSLLSHLSSLIFISYYFYQTRLFQFLKC